MSYLLILEHKYYYFKWLDLENKVSEKKSRGKTHDPTIKQGITYNVKETCTACKNNDLKLIGVQSNHDDEYFGGPVFNIVNIPATHQF